MHAPMPLLLLLLPFLLPSSASAATHAAKSTYIVHVAKSQMPAQFSDHNHWYQESLRSVSVSGSPELLYTYNTVAHGFSARLTAAEAAALSKLHGVVSVVPDTLYELHTTRSPEFLGLPPVPSLANSPHPTSDIIIGLLDTGAWPQRKNYADDGIGPVPPKWKGVCEEGPGFPAASCNRKLIGARFFLKGYEGVVGPILRETRSPLDDEGHGTHTSTIAAGAPVRNASLFGFAKGTARGMAVGARVAMYKVCWAEGCVSSDVLAALDKAVEDGVDVLSLSIGGGQAEFYDDMIAVGTFAATEKGIFVACSAGNDGPDPASLNNVAPWMTTVGAGSIDRDFPGYVELGNGKNYTGVSLYSGKQLDRKKKPSLVYAGNVSKDPRGHLCLSGTLIREKVAGKIVLCDRGGNAKAEKGYVVKRAGGVGMIVANTAVNGEDLVADAHFLPAVNVGQKVGDKIRAYIASDPAPTATIFVVGTVVGVRPAPVLAAFSSRGPNGIAPGLLKPDVIAPGLDILAAWSGKAGPTSLPFDARRTAHNIVSGTSMSCPHVSGIAALLKAAHPDWSPAAIKSALMTTAYNSSKGSKGVIFDVGTGGAATPFGIGAGHVDPMRALDPGLVYDASPEDYLRFLCAINYSPVQISKLTRRAYTCDPATRYAVEELNYPSFAVVLGKAATVRHTRTVTNVGGPAAYKVSVAAVAGVEIAVEPTVLDFKEAGEKKGYTVTFTAASQPPGTTRFGRLEWSDGRHVVASPIAFSWT